MPLSKGCCVGELPLAFPGPLSILIPYSVPQQRLTCGPTTASRFFSFSFHLTVRGPRWQIDLQPWAGPARSLDEEALRFLKYISTIQIECDHMSTDSLATDSSPTKKPWPVCLDDRFGLVHQIRNKQCRLYSLGLGSDDTHFEVGMASNGCEVHRFDPSVKSAHVLESERLWFHRLSIDWRDPHPAVAAQKPYGNTRKLGAILNEFGHHKEHASRSYVVPDKRKPRFWPAADKIDVLKADLESAEWKVLENLILEDVLEQIGQLIFEIHLHWPGFEGPPLIEGPQLCFPTMSSGLP
ncbi:PREDICTED: methyltransferase-like protein 24 [Bison bison bison]|uniref:Methyltransferase-like protein 24 n=1 Tax=Bison bison bison TaxID=43346 RepID=A0A6P3IKZ5_BISBB|nr:PREDICTED: methyltransferase-like protein 24 [Bison bison bison]